MALIGSITSLLGLYSSIIIIFGRWGLETSLLLTIACILIIFAISFSPFLIPHKLLSSDYGWAAQSATIIALISCPLALQSFPQTFIFIYASITAIAMYRAAIFFPKKINNYLISLLLPLFLAIYFTLSFQTQQNGVNLFAPEFAKLGWLTSSGYFNNTITYFLQNFESITLGIDGLENNGQYHIGSHLWFAAIGKLSNTNPLLTILFSYMIIIIPTLLYATLILISKFSEARRVGISIGLTVIGWLTLDLLSFPIYYISESYGFTLALMLCSIPLLYCITDNLSKAHDFKYYFLILFALFLLIPLTISKISFGLIWAELLVFTLLYNLNSKREKIVVVILISFLLFLVLFSKINEVSIFWSALLNSSNGCIFIYNQTTCFGFFKFYLENPIFLFFLLGATSIILTGLLSLIFPKLNLENGDYQFLSPKLYSFQNFNIGILLILSLSGYLVAGINLGSNDSWYFVQPAQWIAMCFVVVWSTNNFHIISTLVINNNRPILKFFILIILVAIASCQLIKVFFNFNATIVTARAFTIALKPNDISLKSDLDRVFLKKWIWNIIDNNLFDSKFNSNLAQSPGGAVESISHNFIANEVHHKAIFVTPEQYSAWKNKFEVSPYPSILPQLPRKSCEIFFVQSITGIPLLLGYPPKGIGCDKIAEFSLTKKGDLDPFRSRSIDNKNLCDLAKKRDIKSILILRDVHDFSMNEILICP